VYRFAVLVAWFVSLFSFRALERFANIATWVFFDVCRFRRSLMLKNLDIAFPSEYTRAEKIGIARRSFSHFLQTILEVLISKKHPIEKDVEVVGSAHLDEALAKGQGCYIVAFHMGNWEAMGATITRRFRPAYTAVKKVGSSGLNRYVEERREQNGLYWLPRTSPGAAVKKMFQVLKEGNIVGFIMDQARPGEPRLPFFSKSAKTNTSLAAIWLKRPAPVLVACITRKAFGSHRLEFQPALELSDTGEREADVLANSLVFNQAVERNVRLHPEQYFWFHNRWK
jgi:KDO2-lipid IV(A) lauroyltransferase